MKYCNEEKYEEQMRKCCERKRLLNKEDSKKRETIQLYQKQTKTTKKYLCHHHCHVCFNTKLLNIDHSGEQIRYHQNPNILPIPEVTFFATNFNPSAY